MESLKGIDLLGLFTLPQGIYIYKYKPSFIQFWTVPGHVYGSLYQKSRIFTGQFFLLKGNQNVVLKLSLKSILPLNITPVSNCRFISFSGTRNKSWRVGARRALWGKCLTNTQGRPEETCDPLAYATFYFYFLNLYCWRYYWCLYFPPSPPPPCSHARPSGVSSL